MTVECWGKVHPSHEEVIAHVLLLLYYDGSTQISGNGYVGGAGYIAGGNVSVKNEEWDEETDKTAR